MDTIKLTSNFANIDHQAACRALRTIHRGSQNRTRYWLRLILISAAIGLFVGAFTRYFDVNQIELAWAFMLFCALLLVVLRLQRRQQSMAQANNPFNGEATIILNEKGYQIEHPGHKATVSWSHVSGVTEIDGALLILLGPNQYYPIEARAFDSEAQMAATAKQIQNWIDAAE